MKNRILSVTGLILACVILFTTAQAYGAEMTAKEIVQTMDQTLRGDTMVGEAEMTIVNPNWTRTITMKTWSSGNDDFFIHILSPAREEGTTFLKKDNLLYQYLPSAEMRIKITPSMMLQPWMGSDFTNDDLVKESSIVEDYTHKLLAEETVNGVKTWKIEFTPKPDAAVVWGKLISWIRQDNYNPVKTYYFSEDGEHIKTLSFGNYTKLKDRTYPLSWTMDPLNKEGHRTSIKYKDVEFNEPISNSIFTLKNLEKPR